MMSAGSWAFLRRDKVSCVDFLLVTLEFDAGRCSDCDHQCVVTGIIENANAGCVQVMVKVLKSVQMPGGN